LNGKKSSDERNQSIQDMKTGKLKVIVASTIFDIGIDIPSLDVLINLGGGKSTGRVLQRIGRVIRKFEGKEFAYVVDFYDQCKYLREHSQIRFKTASSEPRFDVRRIS
jgi:superfamily II DNA or RNA helicase